MEEFANTFGGEDEPLFTIHPRVQEALNNMNKLYEGLQEWVPLSQKSARTLDDIADNLDKKHKLATTVRVGGSSVAVAGSLCVLGAGITTLLTAGAAAPLLALTIGGTVASVGGSVVGGMAVLVEQLKESQDMKDATAILEKTQEKASKMQELFLKIKESGILGDQEMQFNILKGLPYDIFKDLNMTLVKAFGPVAYRAVKKVTKVALVIGAKTAARGAVKVVGGIFGLLIELPDLVISSMDLAQEGGTQASNGLRERAKLIRDGLKDIDKVKETLHDSMKKIALLRSQVESCNYEDLPRRQSASAANDHRVSKGVRVADSICIGEARFINQRKEDIQKCLESHNIECIPDDMDDMPRIAVLGSGGGQRAAVGFLGSLRQLEMDKLLDSVLYVAGVSGSTWSMASLYNDPNWSKNVKSSVDGLIRRLKRPSTVTLSKKVEWLKKRKEEGDLSLSDFWGAHIVSDIMKELNHHLLSDEAQRIATNPFPIYSVIEKESHQRKDNYDEWFEMSPHEAGFSGLGVYVNMAVFKSRFEHGQLRKKTKPMDMVQLQGICGSALADGQRTAKEFKNLIWSWFTGESEINRATIAGGCKVTDIVMTMVELMYGYSDAESSLLVMNQLKKLLGVQCINSNQTLWGVDPETWRRKNLKEREQLVYQIGAEIIDSSRTWSQGLESTNAISDIPWVVWNIFPLLTKWEWGTIANFLYKYQNPSFPQYMQSERQMHLMDAGLMMNSPYPPILRPERDVDLIISFDFSEGDPFETVMRAQDYAFKTNRAFPNVESSVNEDRHCPKSCYVFEGRRTDPTILHIPLFNRDNCKDEQDIQKEINEYKTFQRGTYSADRVQHLLNKAAANVSNNKATIMQEIRKAIKRRRQKQHH